MSRSEGVGWVLAGVALLGLIVLAARASRAEGGLGLFGESGGGGGGTSTSGEEPAPGGGTSSDGPASGSVSGGGGGAGGAEAGGGDAFSAPMTYYAPLSGGRPTSDTQGPLLADGRFFSRGLPTTPTGRPDFRVSPAPLAPAAPIGPRLADGSFVRGAQGPLIGPRLADGSFVRGEQVPLIGPRLEGGGFYRAAAPPATPAAQLVTARTTSSSSPPPSPPEEDPQVRRVRRLE